MLKLFRPLFDAMIPEYVYTESQEDQRQFFVTAALILIASGFLVLLGIVTSLQGETLLSVFDFSIAGIFVGLGIILKESGRISEISTLLVVFLAVYFFYLFNYGGLDRSTWVWYYTFPLWAIFIKGKRSGTALSIILIAVTAASYLFLSSVGSEQLYSANLMFRFTLSYLCVTIVTFVMEDARVSTYHKLTTSNSELSRVIQELQETKGQLDGISSHDTQTGLRTARHYSDILALTIKHANRYRGSAAVMFIEFDYCASYQSHFGKTAADKVFRRIAAEAAQILESESDTLCRITNERIAAVFSGIRPESVERLASAVNKSVQSLHIVHDKSPYKVVTVSVGSAIIPEGHDEISAEHVEALAESALERSGQKGKNSVSSSLLYTPKDLHL